MILCLAIVGLVMFTFICGCPCACINCFDEFTRSNDTDINTGSPCGFVEDAGSWEISSSALLCTSSNGRARCTTTSASVEAELAFFFTATSSGDEVLGIVDYQDASNYHFAKVTVNGASSSLKLFIRAIGVDTELTTTSISLNAGTRYALTVCVNQDDILLAKVTSGYGGTGTVHGTADRAITPYGFGVVAAGTGTITTSVSFDDFRLRSVAPNCATCTTAGCANCVDNLSSHTYRVVVTGIKNNVCLLCAAYNATYIVQAGALGICDPFVNLSAGCAGYIRVHLNLDPDDQITVDVGDSLAANNIRYQDTATSGALIDCDELNGRVVPFSSTTGTQCTGGGSATVTAL